MRPPDGSIARGGYDRRMGAPLRDLFDPEDGLVYLDTATYGLPGGLISVIVLHRTRCTVKAE